MFLLFIAHTTIVRKNYPNPSLTNELKSSAQRVKRVRTLYPLPSAKQNVFCPRGQDPSLIDHNKKDRPVDTYKGDPLPSGNDRVKFGSRGQHVSEDYIRIPLVICGCSLFIQKPCLQGTVSTTVTIRFLD